jgi:FMN-dependent NADH-azoreductase
MRIVAFNSSPRGGGQSKTELMLNYLIEGMRNAGADAEVVNLREKNIKNCIGCFTCWTKTPGKCLHKDDMTKELFPKWLKSDMVVYATPLYYHFINSLMSTFLERTLPAIQPFFERAEGKTYHPLRHKLPSIVLLSVCGFPEDSEFDALSEFVNRTRHKDIKIVAEIYRPAAETMTSDFLQDKINDILEATKSAGKELVLSGTVLPETMARIRQPLIDHQTFADLGNIYWKTCIAEGVTPKEFREKELVPRPDSIESFMLLLPFGLHSEAVGQRKVILQFNFSGELTDSCYFIIDKCNVDAKRGSVEKPDVTIETPFGLWMDIMTRKADGQQMFMEQKYRVDGDISLMIQLFKKNES